jgi:hypothetical protein
MLDLNKSTLYFFILSYPKLDIFGFSLILVDLLKLIFLFHFTVKIAVLNGRIKQAYHHIITDNMGHVLLHLLFNLFESKLFP